MLVLHYYLLWLPKISSLAKSPRLLDKVWLLQCWSQSHWWNQQDRFEEFHTILHRKLSTHSPQEVSSEVVMFGDCIWGLHFFFFLLLELSCSNITGANKENCASLIFKWWRCLHNVDCWVLVFNKPDCLLTHETRQNPSFSLFPFFLQYRVSSTYGRVRASGGWTSGSNWWGNEQWL